MRIVCFCKKKATYIRDIVDALRLVQIIYVRKVWLTTLPPTQCVVFPGGHLSYVDVKIVVRYAQI